MRYSISKLFDLFVSFRRNEKGVTASMVALSLVVIFGIAGFAIDMGHLLWVDRQLQSAVDAAALAGAQYVATSASTAVETATQYSSVGSGDYNYDARIPASFAFQPSAKCFTTVTVPSCANTASGDNGIQVEEKATVPMWFLEIVGIKSLTIKAEATASAKGGNAVPLAVVILLDTTASMGDPDPGCGISGASREECAKAGIQILLQALNPAVDYVAVDTFPGFPTGDGSDYVGCSSRTNPPISTYSSTPSYSIIGFNASNNDSGVNFSSSSSGLNTSNGVVEAVGNGGSCSGGIPNSPPGGEGTYYATAITAAQAQLKAFDATVPTAQNVIIFLSDGGAGSGTAETDFSGYITTTSTTTKGVTTITAVTLTVTKCCTASSSGGQPQTAGQLAVGEGMCSGQPGGNPCQFGTGEVAAGTTITKFLTGTGGLGTYALDTAVAQTVGSTGNPASMIAGALETLPNGSTVQMGLDQCAQAIYAAQTAANAGTWVYSVAYGSENETGATQQNTCTSDYIDTADSALAGISSCQTMQAIANSPGNIPDKTKFYSDGDNGEACTGAQAANTISDLTALFSNLATTLTQPRLIANNAT